MLLKVPYHLEAPDFTQAASGLYLPRDVARAQKRPVAVDLFAGAGGFSLGFMQAGFQVIAAVDHDTGAALTYTVNLGAFPMRFVWIEPEDEGRMEAELKRELKRRELQAKAQGKSLVRGFQTGAGWRASHPEEPGVPFFFLGDIRKLSGGQLLDTVGLKRGEVDCVMGGPPCQGFSRAGQQNVMDPRNSLVFDFARLILEIEPKTFIMENVPDIVNMVTPEGLNVVDAFCHLLSDGGFASYNALRGQLMGRPERKGALRQASNRDGQGHVKPTRKRGQAPRDPETVEPEQLGLFEGAA